MTFERYAPMRAQSIPLAAGDAGTSQTIRAMRQLIEQGKKDPRIHELAASIVANCPPEYTAAGEIAAARAIYEWGLANIRYTPDVTGKETLHSAWDIRRLRIGDCDDFTILFCSLLETIGKTTRIVTISSHAEDPDQFSHVFPEVLVRGRWIPIDAARRSPAFSKGPEHWYRRREWSTTSDEYVDVGGLQGYAQRQAMGYAPAALPAAYRTSANPIIRRAVSRIRARAPMGQGHYGLGEVRRLGQDEAPGYPAGQAPLDLIGSSGGGTDWSGIASAIQAGTIGTANIISAQRASPYNLFPTTSLTAPGAQPIYPYGGVPQRGAFGSGAFNFSGQSMLLLGLGAVALLALGLRR